MAKRARQQWFLRDWRLHRNLTQQELADRLNSTTSRISELETGSERYNQDVLEALAEALSTPEEPVTPGDLISRRPTDPESPFKIWDRIPERERTRVGRIIGPVMEEFAEFEHDQPIEPDGKRRKKRKT